MQSTIETIAAELGHSPTAISKWRERGKVPARHRFAIAERAARDGLTLTAEDFGALRITKAKRKTTHRGGPAADVAAEAAERACVPKLANSSNLSSAAA